MTTTTSTNWVPARWQLRGTSGRPLTAVKRWAADHGYVGEGGGWIRRTRSYDAGEAGTKQIVVEGRAGLVCQGWASFIDRFYDRLIADPEIVEAARKQQIRETRKRIARLESLSEGRPYDRYDRHYENRLRTQREHLAMLEGGSR